MSNHVEPQAAAESAASLTKTDKLALWLTRATFAGMGVSVVIHAVFLIIAGFAVMGGGGSGNGAGGPAGPIELAIVTQADRSAAEDSPMSTLTPGVDEQTEMTTPSLPGVDMPGGEALPDAGDLGAMGSGLGGAGTGTGIGIGEGAGGAGAGGGTSFFGVEARGSRFVYIVDISGSMRGEKLALLKRELKESIESMPENGQFLVVFFESEAVPIHRRERWIEATAKNKKEAAAAIDAIESRGGTNPAPAFVIGFSLKPRADAIYFMTDGLFEDQIVDRVIGMNRGAQKTPIHCLSLVDRSAEPLMRRLSQESGGTYHHIENIR